MDEVTEVTSQGWLSRIMESIKGVVVGLILFVIAFPVLWWNEGRAVQTAKSLEEGQGKVQTVSADKLEEEMDGKLVHLTGEATTAETLQDPTFGLTADAIKLIREVSMFQWVEEKRKKTRKKLGGSKKTVTTYSYRKEWRDDRVDSSRFHKRTGHENPATMPFEDQTVTARTVRLGAYALPPMLVGKMNKTEPLPVTAAALEQLPEEQRRQAQVHDNAIFIGANPGTPAVGDVRVSFSAVLPATVSIVAQQTGSTLEAFQAEAGDAIAMLQYGTHSADKMFQAAAASNATLTWILRVVGFLVMAFGIGLVFNPLAVLADVLPILGDILGAGVAPGLSQTRFMYLSPWRTKDFLHVFGAEGSAEAFALDALLLGAFVFEQAVRHAGEDGEVLRSMVLADG